MLCLFALVAVVGGCGGAGSSSGSGSIDGVRASIDALRPVLAALGLAHTGVPGQTASVRKIYIDSVQNLSTSLGPLASRIVTVKLPPAAYAAQDNLEAGVLELADEARRVVDRIQKAKLSDFPRLASELDLPNSYGVKRMQTALDELRAKGYDLGTLGTG